MQNEQACAARRALAEKVAEYIDLHFTEKISLSFFSEKFHFNANYISYTFKEFMGTGISRYILKKRMEKACGLLTETVLSVKEIAEQTGYEDALYFERVFKKYAGMPPTEYRRKGGKSSVFDAFTRQFYR
ncbi:MAG: hypothetical protein DBX59_05285 [Bacillota bacterium]|nr:MAG: hypothetical protein DBX59_05285 [Bacillota bacterium]